MLGRGLTARLALAWVVATWLLPTTAVSAQYMSVSGTPTLRVTTSVAGTSLLPATDGSTTYTVINVTGTTKKLVAQLSSAMPTGLTLKATAVALGGGTSLGAVTLDTTPRDLVADIGTAFASKSITYQLTADLTASVIASQTRTITYTLVTSP